MSLWYGSDLHLEGRGGFSEGRGDPDGTLVLAGDVCPVQEIETWLPFLIQVCGKYHRVVWVFGNHEWWVDDPKAVKCDQLFETTTLLCDVFCPNLVLVPYRSVVELPELDTTLLCTTLWSYLGPRAVNVAAADLAHIPGLTPSLWRQEHLACVRWLRDEWQARREDKLVFVTHHAPMLKNVSHPRYEHADGVREQVYGTDVLPAFYREDKEHLPAAWIFGHTHWHMSSVWYNVWVQSNPRGNRTERKLKTWRWNGFTKVVCQTDHTFLRTRGQSA